MKIRLYNIKNKVEEFKPFNDLILSIAKEILEENEKKFKKNKRKGIFEF